MNISEKAMLVSVRRSFYQAKVTDKTLQEWVNEKAGARRNVGSVRKDLLGKAAISEYKTAASEIKQLVDSMTMPWDEKYRLLPNTLYPKFIEDFNRLVAKFDDAADRFCIDYPALVRAEREQLGSAWREDDYPKINEIRDKFNIEIEVMPVPQVGDFRVELSQDEIEHLNEKMEKKINAKFARSMKMVWDRLYSTLQDIVSRLEKTDKPHKTIVENIAKLVRLLPDLNLASDPKLEEMRREVERRLCGFDVKQVREDRDVRDKLKAEAEAIMNKMASYMGGPNAGAEDHSKAA